MGKTVTFSFSTKQEDSTVVETFTFEEIGIDGIADEEDRNKRVDAIFREWVWSNISYSYIIEE